MAANITGSTEQIHDFTPTYTEHKTIQLTPDNSLPHKETFLLKKYNTQPAVSG